MNEYDYTVLREFLALRERAIRGVVRTRWYRRLTFLLGLVYAGGFAIHLSREGNSEVIYGVLVMVMGACVGLYTSVITGYERSIREIEDEVRAYQKETGQ